MNDPFMYLKDSNLCINLNHIRSIYNDTLREQIFINHVYYEDGGPDRIEIKKSEKPNDYAKILYFMKRS